MASCFLNSHCSPLVLTPAHRTIGNIVTGNDSQTQLNMRLQIEIFLLYPCSFSFFWLDILLYWFQDLKKRKTPGTFTEQDLDERIRKQQEEEELKRQRREKKREKKKGKVMEEEEPEMDPEVAEMMGFGGFGSSKKS